jgi:hypothetical protein
MFPHERSLVKRLADKPFALLGINSDSDLDDLKVKNEKQQITWRSWWDRSTNGPIATAWNVDGWPTIYVLDSKGTIRYTDVPGEAIDKAIDTLLEEMEKKSKK